MDVATLGLKVDSSQLRRGAQEMDRFAQTGKRASATAGAMGAAFRSAALQVGAMVGAAASIGAAFRSANQYTQIENSFRGIGQSAAEAAASLDTVTGIAMRTRAPLQSTAQLYQRLNISAKELGASQHVGVGSVWRADPACAGDGRRHGAG